MGIFSNGQFDVENQIYVFDPTKGKSGRFLPIDPVQRVSTKYQGAAFLYYKSFKTIDQNVKTIKLELVQNGRIEDIETNLHIHKSGDNEDYENKIRDMLAKAARLSKNAPI